MKLVQPILIGSLLCLGIFQSFIFVTDKPNSRYWNTLIDEDIELNKPHAKESEEQEFSRHTKLQRVLRAEGYNVEAEKILSTDCQRYQNNAREKAKYTETAEALASMKVELADLDKALSSYQSLLNYDRLNKPVSARKVARDINNIGLVYYLRSCTANDTARRRADREQALHFYKTAEKEFLAHGFSDDLYANLMNQYLLRQDEGNKEEAKSLFERIMQLSPAETKADRQMRAMLLQQD